MAGVLTQRTLTWKSLCVPSGEGDMHSCSLIFLPNREKTFISFRPCLVEPTCVSLLCCRDFDYCDGCVVCSDRLQATVCPRAVVMIVIIWTVSSHSSAVVSLASPRPEPFIPCPEERENS